MQLFLSQRPLEPWVPWLLVLPSPPMCRGFPPEKLRCDFFFLSGMESSVRKKASMCVWTSQASSDCRCTLAGKRSNCRLKEVIVFSILETCSQDGRSGVQGMSQGCQGGAPENPNFVPVLSKVAHGAVKVSASVTQGSQREPMA